MTNSDSAVETAFNTPKQSSNSNSNLLLQNSDSQITMQLLNRIQLLELKNIEKKENTNNNSKLVLILALCFVLTFGAAFGVSAFVAAFKSQPDHHQQWYPPTHVTGNAPVPAPPYTRMNVMAPAVPQIMPQPQIMPEPLKLSDVSSATLEQIKQMSTITVQWGPSGSGEEKQYFYSIEAVHRDSHKKETVLVLSGGDQLFVYSDSASLFDSNGERVGIIEFNHETEEEAETEADSDSDTNSQLRKLIRYGHEKQYYKGKTGFDGYCRYGCAQMGITFPMYYRPFFGYGYPLVGTEGMFPAGYGGNPVTELAANGLMGHPGMGAGPEVANIGAAPYPMMATGTAPAMPAAGFM